MPMSIDQVQERIDLVKEEIRRLQYQIARYEDELDNESYYRRDFEKEDLINDECNRLSSECEVLTQDLKRLESLLTLKIKRNVLNEQKERLEAQYQEESNDVALMEIYSLKQDIGYIDSCIKREEKEEMKKTKK